MTVLALLIFIFLPGPTRADGPNGDEHTPEPVLCNSNEYRTFLGDLSTDLFKAAVQVCLDDIRRVSLVKSAQTSTAKNEPIPWTFHAVDPANLPVSCPVGKLEDMKRALNNQLANCRRASVKRLAETRKFGCRNYTRGEWCVNVNQKLLAIAETASDFQDYLEKSKMAFDWYQSDGWPSGQYKNKTQITGYHAPPPIDASAVPTAEYSHPVYRRPSDLKTFDSDSARFCGNDSISGNERKTCRLLPNGDVLPYYTRDEIDNGGALKGKLPYYSPEEIAAGDPITKKKEIEVAWVKDPVEVAFLMVEGSGSLNIRQADGSVKMQKINYDGANGRTLNMLGRILLCEGATPADYSSLTGIKTYLAAHPAMLKTTLALDQSYVFYKTDDGGPYGADDIPVTERHSFATDRRLIPTGTAMLVHTKPLGPKPGGACDEVSSMGISQDSGGAINGPHIDWYMGEGQAAQDAADSADQAGDLFVALPPCGGTKIEGCEEPALPRACPESVSSKN